MCPMTASLALDSQGFLSWSKLGGPWGRRAKDSGESDEGGVGSRQGGTGILGLPQPGSAVAVGGTTPISQVRPHTQKGSVMFPGPFSWWGWF